MHRMIEAFVQQERELWDLANFQGLAEVRANKTRGIAESNQGRRLFTIGTEHGNKDFRIAQIIRDFHTANRHKTDPRILQALHQELADFFAELFVKSRSEFAKYSGPF